MKYVVTCTHCGSSFGSVPGGLVDEGPNKGEEIRSVNCIICGRPVDLDSGRWTPGPGPIKHQVEKEVDLLRIG